MRWKDVVDNVGNDETLKDIGSCTQEMQSSRERERERENHLFLKERKITFPTHH